MIARRALVIDDSKSARFALRRYLEGHRYQVEAVEDAEAAWSVLEHLPVSVVFLDHVMPGVDGFEILDALRANPATAGLPVVICSSNEGPEFNERACARGARAVLQKPPNPEQLQRILEGIENGGAVQGAVETPADFSNDLQESSSSMHSADLSLQLPGDLGAGNATTTTAVSSAREFNLAGSPVAKPSDQALREQLDQRMKKVSQGLLVQFAEIKATVAHLANQQAKLAEQPNGLRSELRGGLDETNQALRLVTSRIEGIEREVFSQLTAMRTQLDATLKSHNDRLTEMMQFARQTAAEEAQVVAERTVMTAALRISDQLADAILGAVGRK